VCQPSLSALPPHCILLRCASHMCRHCWSACGGLLILHTHTCSHTWTMDTHIHTHPHKPLATLLQAILSRMLLHPNVVVTYDCCTGMMDASRLQVCERLDGHGWHPTRALQPPLPRWSARLTSKLDLFSPLAAASAHMCTRQLDMLQHGCGAHMCNQAHKCTIQPGQRPAIPSQVPRA